MLRRLLIACVLLICLPAVASADPIAQAAKNCSVSGEERELGATYVTTVTAKGTSCGNAKGVVRAYHSCRGSAKSCGKKVSGYKCSQTVLAESPVQYEAKVSCKKSGAKVKFTYSQNT